MRLSKYKRLASLCFVTVGLLLSTACSNGSAGTNAGGKSDQHVISITFRSGGGANQALTQWLEQKIIPEFKKTHPNVDVKLSPLNVSEGDYFAKIALMLKSGNTAPDIVTEDTFMVNSDASAGYLESLDDKLKGWNEWQQFTENVKNGVIAQDGKIYGVPYNTDSRGLWYNKELFRQAGLPVPWEPKTWDDILTAAKTIKVKLPADVVPLWMNSGKASGEATSMQTFEMLLYGTGYPLYDTEAKKWIVKSSGLTDTFKFIDQIYKQKLGPNLSQVLNGQGGSIAYQQLMPKGKMAIGLDGIWQFGTWRKDGSAPWPESRDVIGYAAMPTEKGQSPGSVSMSGGWAWSIPKNSGQKELAWEFIKLASSKENNLSLLLKENNLSPRKDVAEDPQYQAIPMFKEASAFLKNTHFRPSVDKYPSVSTQIQSLVEDVVTGRLTPEQAAEQYEANVTKIVGKELVTTR